MSKLLMPKATAIWLIDNTSLTFEQIGKFCDLHIVEVQSIADGEIAASIHASNPIIEGQLTREEITRCEASDSLELQLRPAIEVPQPKGRAVPRYVPLSKRAEKPDAIAWCLSEQPDLSDAQLVRLIGTTKNTINAIRSRSHWNMANLKPRSPAEMGICTFEAMSEAVKKAKAKAEKEEKLKKSSAAKESVQEDQAL